MPTYDYACASCGSFAAFRPMADYAKPADCPGCGVAAPRAFLTAPALAGMDGAARRAHGVNERSRHEPRRSHAAGCGCCSPGKAARTAPAGAAKSFPSKRPWMISH